ncbi:MAG: class I SAM-dependent methyltransferase [Clostridiales bacterium]|jgi:ubiquinone/menaquinone biosynthesis C-methylase UbiE|nr:class I SAM-dependent methyltransferase [Clostridiales bacterium]
MDNEQIQVIDLIIETHIGLERQDPGSHEMTAKALSFLDTRSISRAADLGCGTASQMIILADSLHGSIVGLDQIPGFIDILNANALKRGLQDRVSGIVGSMENLPFQKGEFDLIWSEGAIDAIGFEKGLTHWNSFLKMNGYVAVACPCWFTDEHPDEVERFWSDAGSGLDTIEHNISAMQRAGYAPIAVFTLPEQCWTDNYFAPRAETEKVLLSKYAGNKTAEAYV